MNDTAYGVAVTFECSKSGRHAFIVSGVAKPLAAVKVKGLMCFDFDPGETLRTDEMHEKTAQPYILQGVVLLSC